MAPLLGILLVLAAASARASLLPDSRNVCVRSPDDHAICGKIQLVDDFEDRGRRDASLRKICVENPVNHETVCGPVIAQVELRGFDGDNRAGTPPLPPPHVYSVGGYYPAPAAPPPVYVPPPPPPHVYVPPPPPPPAPYVPPPPPPPLPLLPPNYPKVIKQTILFREAAGTMENTDDQTGSGRMVAPPPEEARSSTGIEVHGLESMPDPIKTNLIRRVVAARKPALSMIIDCDIRPLSEEPLPTSPSYAAPLPPAPTATEAPETPVPDARSAAEEVDPLSSAEFPKLMTRLHDLIRTNNTVKDEFGKMMGIPHKMNETATELLGLEKQLQETHRKQTKQIQRILEESETQKNRLSDLIADLRMKQKSTGAYRYGVDGYSETMATGMMSNSYPAGHMHPLFGNPTAMEMGMENMYRKSDISTERPGTVSGRKNSPTSDSEGAKDGYSTGSDTAQTQEKKNKPGLSTTTEPWFSF